MSFDLVDTLCNNLGLCISEFGILLEFMGAAWIVIAACRNRELVEKVDNTVDGPGVIPLKEAIQGQAITEVRGFTLLAIGLLMQFIGGLPLFSPT